MCHSPLPNSHTLYIGVSGLYEQNYDEPQGYISPLPNSHTLYIGFIWPI